MDGWMNEWMDRWIDGWIDGSMDELQLYLIFVPEGWKGVSGISILDQPQCFIAHPIQFPSSKTHVLSH